QTGEGGAGMRARKSAVGDVADAISPLRRHCHNHFLHAPPPFCFHVGKMRICLALAPLIFISCAHKQEKGVERPLREKSGIELSQKRASFHCVTFEGERCGSGRKGVDRIVQNKSSIKTVRVTTLSATPLNEGTLEKYQ